ncbi:MAG TPA: ABC transporter permease [Phototrophicaceae bacterium]|nr:ABC transporter permease [Phototrophicaceae bacterium]
MAITRPLFDIPFVRRSDKLRTFLTAVWLGWQIESNWADPFLFAVYSIARPIASVLILVVMYSVITNGAMQEPIFAYIYLGNALYILVGQVISGVSWSVIDDREHYRTLRQLHTTPMDGYFYLMGRGVARLVVGLVSVLITIGFGIVFFHLPITIGAIDWLLFIFSTALGVLALAAIGMVVGSLTMMLARHFWSVGEAISGALYLFTGAIFPLDVLPAWLRPVGFVFPVTYWLELARRAILGPSAAKFPTLAGFSDLQLMGILAVMTLALLVFSWFFYKWALHLAKETGFFDMETSY